MKRLIPFFFLVCLSSLVVSDSYKKWINNNSNSNMEHWTYTLSINGLHFPTNLSKAVALSSDRNDYCQIIIPTTIDDDDENQNKNNFANDDYINSTSQSDDDSLCTKIDKTKIEGAYWLDPRNWYSFTGNEATPHVERLPCIFDIIEFPNSNEWFVILPNRNLSVQALVYDSYRLRNWNFRFIIQMESFLKHFVVSGNRDVSQLLTITGKKCFDKLGCECGTLNYYEEICSLIENECSQQLPCPFPVKPTGHCCPICGGYIKAYYDPTVFIFNKFKLLVKRFLKNTVLKIETHISKIRGDAVHIVIINKDGDEDGVYNITVALRNTLNAVSHIGIIEVEWYSSGSIRNPELWKKTFHLIETLFFASIFVGICVLLYKSKRSFILKRPFSFVKIETESEKLHFGLSESEKLFNSSMNDINNEVKLQNSQTEEAKLENETVHD